MKCPDCNEAEIGLTGDGAFFCPHCKALNQNLPCPSCEEPTLITIMVPAVKGIILACQRCRWRSHRVWYPPQTEDQALIGKSQREFTLLLFGELGHAFAEHKLTLKGDLRPPPPKLILGDQG